MRDIQSIEQLGERRGMIISSELPAIDKAMALLDDCKRFGTLAFSHAARAGFVATTLLKSFVTVGAMTDERRLTFLKSFSTVTGEFKKDKSCHATGTLSKKTLIAKYGHLRPGTYEVAAQAYWEDPQCYLISESKLPIETKPQLGAN